MTDHSSLPSWRDTTTRRAIEAFVASVTEGPDAVPVEERIAVFDNDGTLWSEKPMPTQLHYVVEQWRSAAERSPELAERQPYLAAVSGDFGWLSTAIDKHYSGDDSDLKTIIQALVGLTDGMSVEDYALSVGEFYRTAQHPALKRPYADAVYQPMVELLRYLEGHGFTCYIVSGGERDFMRPMTQANYGIPPERVVGSAFGLTWDDADATVKYSSSLAFFDDGPEKPVRIWSRIGRRPLFAGGNSNGDTAMLDFARKGPRPGFAILVHHDDPDRGDAPYDAGAEKALAAADDSGYTVVSVRDDWATVFPQAASEVDGA
ncbi:haloacid dehalogenase-like hydrolase [Microbacterium sp. ISL-59]|uniref:HAD family hydrolase n=1 Tax=Microbacterium sp. ISL-59 TaxID=2819159 RepID=UPI001BEA0FA6|nr:HAD family hydrolase [Microbacterium sp. ISL-59]MBT2494479.1 haloacid dehalogenase-like hydrolase [Microbacterium sp. ISL-59]